MHALISDSRPKSAQLADGMQTRTDPG